MKTLLLITIVGASGPVTTTSEMVYECESYKKHLEEIIPQDEVLRKMHISIQCVPQ